MYSVSIKSTESWGQSGNGLLSITNTSAKPIPAWTFKVALKNAVITACWDVDFLASGSTYTFKGKDWNKDLAPGQTLTSGFAYNGTATFTASTTDVNVKLVKATPVVPPTPTPAPKPVVPTPVPQPTPVPPTPQPTPSPVVPVTPSTSPLKKKVITYFCEWDLYQRAFQVADIPGDKLTHVMYAFSLPNPSQADVDILKANYPFPPLPYTAPPALAEASLAIHDAYAWSVQVPQFAQLKAKYPHLKIGLSVGGWTLSWTMSKVMADPVLRKTFITTSVDCIVKNGFDTFDLDWEYPGIQGQSYNIVDKVNDAKNLVTFLKELRVEINKRSPSKYIEISIAAGANPAVLEQYKELGPLLDSINLMTYDFYGSWGDCGHLSALYPNPQQGAGAINGFDCDSAVKHTLKYFKPEQICLGIPMYSRGWAKAQAQPNQPIIFGKSIGGPGVTRSENKGGEPGLTCIKDLYPLIKSKEYTEYFDEVARVPYCVKESTGEVWSYDNVQSVTEKVKYVCDNNLGGVMTWQLSDDVRNNGEGSLLNAIVGGLKTYAK